MINTKTLADYEVSFFIAYSQNHTLNAHADISSGARGLQLHSYFVRAANALASLYIWSQARLSLHSSTMGQEPRSHVLA